MKVIRAVGRLAVAALAAAAILAPPSPASAGDTTTTFTLTAGALTIGQPASLVGITTRSNSTPAIV